MSQRDRRILKQIQSYQKEKTQSGAYSITVDKNNLSVWQVKIKGPQQTPYQGGIFNLQCILTSDYPFKPPKFIFKTKIFHQNVHQQGHMCCCFVDFHNWLPSNKVQRCIRRIIGALSSQYKGFCNLAYQDMSREEYIKKAKEWTTKYAKQQ